MEESLLLSSLRWAVALLIAIAQFIYRRLYGKERLDLGLGFTGRVS